LRDLNHFFGYNKHPDLDESKQNGFFTYDYELEENKAAMENYMQYKTINSQWRTRFNDGQIHNFTFQPNLLSPVGLTMFNVFSPLLPGPHLTIREDDAATSTQKQ
jgi:hypothetical protein